MPTAFNPGSGGTLKSSQLVSAFVEAAQLVANAELAITEVNRPTNMAISSDLRLGTLTIAASLPVTISVNSSAQAVISAFDYIAVLAASGGNSTFIDGGSELNATNLVSAFWELASKLSAAELALPEATRPNNLTISSDFDGGTATISASIPIVVTFDTTGKLVVDAVNYL
jgi:hypothetical protein